MQACRRYAYLETYSVQPTGTMPWDLMPVHCGVDFLCDAAGGVLQLPSITQLDKAGRSGLKKAIYELGGRQAVAEHYSLECQL